MLPQQVIAEPLALLSPHVFSLTLDTMQSNKQAKRNRKNKLKFKQRKRNNISRREDKALIMPPVLLRNLRYVDASYVRNAPGNNYLVYSFRVNDLFDPDPLILSGSISGFKEIMQFYQYYRVLHCSAEIHVVNQESFPLMYGCVWSQSNLTGSISSRDDAMNALEDPMSVRAHILSAKGGLDRGTLTTSMQMSRILGIRSQYRSESNYAGNGLATPTVPLWLNFIVASPTGTALVNGYVSTTSLTFRSEFFGLLNLRT